MLIATNSDGTLCKYKGRNFRVRKVNDRSVRVTDEQTKYTILISYNDCDDVYEFVYNKHIFDFITLDTAVDRACRKLTDRYNCERDKVNDDIDDFIRKLKKRNARDVLEKDPHYPRRRRKPPTYPRPRRPYWDDVWIDKRWEDRRYIC